MNRMKDDKQGGHMKLLLTLTNAVAIQTSNGNWISDFYLPEMTCAESEGQLILFKSKATSDSYIHYNKNQFKLFTHSHVVFKHVNGRWKSVNVHFGNSFT